MEYSKYIDHTLLKTPATENDIKKLCQEAKEYGFFSVCVNPFYVKLSKKELEGSDVKVACVVGFPLGMNATEIKFLEAKRAIEDGADEIDMVVNMGLFKSGKFDEVIKDINAVCKAGALVKVIVETSQLNSEEVAKMCEIVNKSDATFIKTSTGFVGEGARLNDVVLMKSLMKEGKKIKASGGIRDYQTFIKMIDAGADRIGTSSGVQIIKEANENK